MNACTQQAHMSTCRTLETLLRKKRMRMTGDLSPRSTCFNRARAAATGSPASSRPRWEAASQLGRPAAALRSARRSWFFTRRVQASWRSGGRRAMIGSSCSRSGPM